MIIARRTSAPLLAALLLAGAGLRAEDKPVFDRGEKYDLEHGIVYKDKKPEGGNSKKLSETETRNQARKVKLHIANLKDPDPQVRATSAEMLGMIGSPEAVPYLIEALRDNEGHVNVQIRAHGALNRITGKDFGYLDYPRWNQWWISSKDEFLKQAQQGPTDLAKVNARASNTQGLMLLSAGDYALAKGKFLDAVDKDPEIPDYKNNLGLAFMELGDFISAIYYFKETTGLNPDLPQPYMNIGMCYSRMTKHIEAQHWYRRAMEKDGDGTLWQPLWTLGKQYLNNSEFSMAKEFLEQSAKKASRKRVFDPRIYRDLALTYYGLDMHHSAWWAINQVWKDGFDLDAGFVEKVRAGLKAAGADPDSLGAKLKEHDLDSFLRGQEQDRQPQQGGTATDPRQEPSPEAAPPAPQQTALQAPVPARAP